MDCDRHRLEAAYARTLLPLARMWRHAADQALKSLGISSAAGWALVQVGRLGNDVRQTDLADALDVTGASLVRLLDQMVANGLVDRHRDPADARVSRVRLTDRGQAQVTTIEQAFAALRREMLHGVSDRDLATALDVAERLEGAFARKRGR